MLLRVFLILALLAGIGTVAVTQFMVRPHVQQIVEERNTHEKNWQTQLSRANKLDRDLKDTQTKLVTTENTLKETEGKLVAETARAEEQNRRANTLQQTLDSTKRDLTTAQQDLAAWNALGVPVDQVARTIESEKRFRAANAVLQEEKIVLLRENGRLTNIIHELRGGEEAPVVMPGLAGKIIAVDPKWNFVVLDVGEKAGAKQRGILMVSREGRLVGKVRISSVQADRSVANIVPGWQLGDMMEGDQVFYVQ